MVIQKSLINKKLRWILGLSFLLISVAWANTRPVFQWQVGEQLTYSVKWSFFTLGKLKLTVLGSDTLAGRKVYHCRINIDSNPSLPFVNIHDIYDSFMDAEDFSSNIFLSYEHEHGYLLFTRYNFNYRNNTVRIYIEKRKEGKTHTVLDSTGQIPGRVYDSLSMLYYSRGMVKNDENTEIPVFVYNHLKKLKIKFTGSEKDLKIDDKRLETYYLQGKLRFVGVAGIKDEFKGWFSSDSQSVPLHAKMKAFIGHVNLDLESWENWPGGKLLGKLKPSEDEDKK